MARRRDIAVRWGHTVTYLATSTEAAAFVRTLNAGNDDTGFSGPSTSGIGACTTLQCARDAAAGILDLLVRHIDLQVPAAASLHTALRVPGVRARIADKNLRGQPLERWLQHIAAADSAARHLTPAAIADVLDRLTATFSKSPQQAPPSPAPATPHT